MSEENLEKVYHKIDRLLKKAESNRRAGPIYEQEAETAAFLAAQLMHTYKIDQGALADYIRRTELDKLEPLGWEDVFPSDYGFKRERHRVQWQAILAQTVAENCSCGVLNVNPHQTNTVRFYGRESDRKSAIYIWTFLVREVVRRTDEYIEDFRKRGKMKVTLNGTVAYRKANTKELQIMRGSYISGLITGLAGRIKEHRRKTIMNSQNPRALEILDNSLEEAVRFMQEHARYRTDIAFNVGDFASTTLDGYEEARLVNISPAIETAQKELLLTGGQ